MNNETLTLNIVRKKLGSWSKLHDVIMVIVMAFSRMFFFPERVSF